MVTFIRVTLHFTRTALVTRAVAYILRLDHIFRFILVAGLPTFWFTLRSVGLHFGYLAVVDNTTRLHLYHTFAVCGLILHAFGLCLRCHTPHAVTHVAG